MATLVPLDRLGSTRFERPALLKRLASSRRALAELKGFAASIPNQGILINTLVFHVLYLVREGLLDIPVLYLSSHIVRTEAGYYRLLQAVRDGRWEEWVAYLLEAVEVTAGQTVATIHSIKAALPDFKHRIRDGFKFYSQDLINHLFMHPYTRIDFVSATSTCRG